ncbi:MAG: terminase large subunit [Planctomycetaceae bacterium]|nr:terminase large subunit [Planctomycetaceae bacterium]
MTPRTGLPPGLKARTAAAWTTKEIRAHAAARERWPGVTMEISDCDGRYYFDQDEADRYCDFFPTFLEHSEGEFGGKPFELMEWQRLLVVRPFFGWKLTAKGCGCKACGGDPGSPTFYDGACRVGLRRFRTLFLMVPKKNGKTPLVAGLSLAIVHLDGENEPGAQVLVAAAEKEQARGLFDHAWTMTEKNPVLAHRSRLRAVGPKIFIPSTRAGLRAISAEARGKHGPNLHGLVFDELHEQPDAKLYNALTKAVAARRQPVTIFITTAGDDVTSICHKEQEHAEDVIKGTSQDLAYLPVIFAASPKDDWTKPSTWRRANPSYGITVKPDYLANEVARAQEDPSRLATFLQLHLDIWAQQADPWLAINRWEECRVPRPLVIPAGCQVAAGLDLAAKLDLCAFAALVRRPLEGAGEALDLRFKDADGVDQVRRVLMNFSIDLHVWFWIPKEPMFEHEREDKIEYSRWVREGFVTATEGNMTDYPTIYEDLTTKILPAFKAAGSPIQEIGFDPANAGWFVSKLQETGIPTVEVTQTTTYMSDPAKLLKALIHSRRVAQDGNPCLAWNAGNAVAREDAKENIFVKKPTNKHTGSSPPSSPSSAS